MILLTPEQMKLFDRTQQTFPPDTPFFKAIEEINELSAQLVRYLNFKGKRGGRDKLLKEFFDALFCMEEIFYRLDISEEEMSVYQSKNMSFVESLINNYSSEN